MTINGSEAEGVATSLWGGLYLWDVTQAQNPNTTPAFEYVANDNLMYFDSIDTSLYGTYTVKVEQQASSGLEYEEGTYTPTSDTARPTISFTNTHSTMPVFVMMTDATGTYSDTSNTQYIWAFYNFYWTGQEIYQDSQNIRYGEVRYVYRATTATSFSAGNATLTSPPTSTDDSSSSYYRYWVTESNFRPYAASSSRYWRTGRTYKWVAIWAPTT